LNKKQKGIKYSKNFSRQVLSNSCFALIFYCPKFLLTTLANRFQLTHSFPLNPHSGEHVILLYDDYYNRDDAVINYINEGLKRNQLCVYGVVNSNKKAIAKMSSKIVNYQENVKKENLLVLDLKKFYFSALGEDLTPFDDIKQQLVDKVKDRSNKHVRIVGDCGSFLFKNKHFDECMALEQWWQKKPFEGSYVCPYPKSTFNEYTFSDHKDRLFNIHDTVIMC